MRVLLFGAGAYWFYVTTRHSGDLIARAESVGLMLLGVWAHHLVNQRPMERAADSS